MAMGRTSAYRQEEIRNVMRNIHRQAHIREMKSITQPNQCQRDHMVSDQLFEIFPRLFQQQAQNNRLLRPVTRLQEIVRFESPFVTPMRKPFEHARRVEIPHRRPGHHVEPQWTKDSEIDCRVGLFHEAVLLCPTAYVPVSCQWAEVALHNEFAGEGQNDNVETHEGEIQRTLAVIGSVGFRMIGE